MAQDIAELGLRVRADGVVVATKQLRDMEKAAGRTEKASERLSAQMRDLGRNMARVAAVGGAAMAALAAKSLKAGIAAEEVASKFRVVFAGSVERTDKALQDLTRTIPLTTSEMRAFAAMAQDMLVPLGIARDQAADMSVEIVRLAGDISAFINTDVDQVLQNIQSALAGEAQVLRKYGIAMNEARLQQVAFEMGITETTRRLTFQERALAAVEVITRDTADAAGFAEAELNSAAGQVRAITRDFRQLEEDLGTALIPAFQQFLGILNESSGDGMTRFQSGLELIGKAMTTVVSAMFIVIEAGKQLGRVLVGLGVAAYNSAQAIAAPFIELNTTVAMALERMASGDFSGAAGVFEGLVGRITTAYQEQAAEAMQGLDFIGESITEGVEQTLNDVGKLMTAFSSSAGNVLSEGGQNAGRSLGNGIAKGVEGELIPALRNMSADIAAELEDSFAFVTNEGFLMQSEALQDEIAALAAGAEAWREYQRAQFQASEVAKLGADATADQIKEIETLAGVLFDLRNPMEGLVDVAVSLGDAMTTYGSAFEDVIRSIQGGVERGTDEYKKLELAVQAANIVQAIGAILNQAQGDPYSAPARMAAMAAIVSSLVGSAFTISGLSGGGADPTAARQASQGTGTVLGDSEAKSESIVNSLEIVADATSELVGINRGMLRALTNLADAIGGASRLLAGQNTDFGALPSAADFGDIFPGSSSIGNFLLDPLGILGGSVDIRDTGLTVLAGTLSELLEGGLIQAFQDLEISDHVFDSGSMERRTEELSDAINGQFTLVFEALIDTVTEAATVLGFSMDEIQTALDQFQVYAQDISFEDLNAEEQQAELEAFFGRIFDRLAHEVVPFLSDFQQVGEGMGETLTRVATSVLVFDEGMKMLGFNIENLMTTTFASSEDFRYRSTVIKVALVDLAGGLEQFIDQITSFFDAFATDEFKFSFLLESVETRFRELGMTLPDTREGIFNLMQSLDASTESGAAAIAMLLELTPLLDEYYSIVEEQERRRLQQAQMLNEYLGGPSSGLTALRNRFVEAMEAAKSLNATQREYAMIVRAFDRELQRFTAQLTINIIQQSQALFGSAAQAAGDEFEQGFEGVRRVANSLFSEWQRAISNIRGFADDVLLDTNLTTLTPSQRLAESQSQFERLLAAARGGDVDAANALPDAARAFLEAARFMFASGEDYTRIFNRVQDDLRGITMPDGIPEWTEETANNTARTAAAVEAMQNATVNELQRLLEAMTLSESLRDLGYALDRSPVELARELGVPLDQLAEALGIDLHDLSRDTVMGLVNMAELLGTDLDDLGAALGINIAGLADQFGIIFDAINFESRFLTQEDWLERIRDQLEETNTWLEIISGVRTNTSTIDPSVKDPSTPGGPGPTIPGDSSLTSVRDDEAVKILTDIRDDNEKYHAKMEDMNKRLLQVQEEVASITRRSVA